MDVALDDVLALELVEPAPAASPAGRSRFHNAIAMRVGPYHVEGELRVRPGADPVEELARSSGFVVLRDAWIEYPIGPARRRRLAARLAVNAGRAESFGLVGEVDRGPREEPARLCALLGSGREGGRT